MLDTRTKVDMIVKFIKTMFSPRNVIVHGNDDEDFEIKVYFDEIPSSYITSATYSDLKTHKERSKAREIKRYIYDYLGIRTNGEQFDITNARNLHQYHGIEITVSSKYV